MANEKNVKKNLNLAELKKQVEKLDEKVLHDIKVGEDTYTVGIDSTFRKTKQFRLLDDLVHFFNEGAKRLDLLELATPYVSLLFIKHFTDVEVSDDIDEAIETLNALVDLELLGQILNLMPDEDVNKVYELITATTEKMNENITEGLKQAEELKKEVENPQVKEMLENGKE